MNKLIQTVFAVIALSFSSSVFAGFQEDLDLVIDASLSKQIGADISPILRKLSESNRLVFFEDEKEEARRLLHGNDKNCLLKRIMISKEYSIKDSKWAISETAEIVRKAGSLKEEDLRYYSEQSVMHEAKKRGIKSKSEVIELGKEMFGDFHKASSVLKGLKKESPDACIEFNQELLRGLKEIAK